ncbi:MAG: prepilin-type N-terminal cleavage/methylation domain-containing protein [Candidatus Saccharibacteria bacterium]|nr:prepilin-type N-terminal cleavage/methylation domain-containing protein [Candidatus Saccharibacteria bacterium]
MAYKKSKQSAFTIVELLVVIVVIGILAAITIVTYANISQKATVASIQSDLSNAQTQLKLFQTDNTAFPNSVTDCPVPSTGSLCLKVSSGNTISSYSANNSANPQTYSLSVMHGSTIYTVTSTTVPTTLASAPLSPVADWLAMAQGDHYGNVYDLIGKQWATVARVGPKTIYDPGTNHVYDVPDNYLGINPRSDGKSGSEAEFENTGTNYITNSYFNTDSNSDGLADSWGETNKATSGATTYTLSNSSIYGKAQRAQYTGQAGDSNSGFDLRSFSSASFVATDPVTESIFIKGACTGCTVKLWAVSYPDYATVVMSSAIALTNQWQRVSVSGVVPAGDTNMYLYIQVRAVDTADVLDISLSAAQVEKAAYTTSYIPTTAAIATRNADSTTIPTTNWNADTGASVVVAGDNPCRASGGCAGGYWRVSSGSNNLRTYAGYTSSYLTEDYNASTYYDSRGITAGYHTRAGRWDNGNTIRSYVDGVAGARTDVYTTLSPFAGTAMLGAYNSSNYFNSNIQRFTFYSSALSDADIMTASNAVKDGP